MGSCKMSLQPRSHAEIRRSSEGAAEQPTSPQQQQHEQTQQQTRAQTLHLQVIVPRSCLLTIWVLDVQEVAGAPRPEYRGPAPVIDKEQEVTEVSVPEL